MCYNRGMLTTFPHLFDYLLIAPTLLRVVVGIIFLSFAYKMYMQKERGQKMISRIGIAPVPMFWSLFIFVGLVGGLFLLVGFFTQITALILALVSGIAFFISLREPEVFENRPEFFLLLMAVLLSLMFLYPGLWTIDIPV